MADSSTDAPAGGMDEFAAEVRAFIDRLPDGYAMRTIAIRRTILAGTSFRTWLTAVTACQRTVLRTAARNSKTVSRTGAMSGP